MKFLKSTAFVGVLALIAFGIVAKNIILPLYKMKAGSSVSKVVEETEDAQNEAVSVLPPSGDFLASAAKLGWFIGALREPFKAIAPIVDNVPSLKADDIEEEDLSLAVDTAPEIEEFDATLTAVVVEGGESFAVIEDAIVTKGDFYDDYEVMDIGQDRVLLSGPNGNINLEF